MGSYASLGRKDCMTRLSKAFLKDSLSRHQRVPPSSNHLRTA